VTTRRHFGSVRKRASGRWQATYWHEGRLHAAPQTFTTKGDALAWLGETEMNIRRGAWVDPSVGRVVFGSYASDWLRTRLAKGRPLSSATRQGYEGLLRRNVLPRFGQAPLAEITPEAVRAWHTDLAERAGPDQAAKSYRLLRAILNTAVEDNRIAANPCRIRGAGIERAGERPMLEVGTILELAEAIDPRLRALVILAGFGGLRTGEMLALERRDVDLVHKTVHVRAAAQEIVGAGRVVGEPKSEAGKRIVAIPQVVAEALDEHLALFAQPGAHGVVFTGPGGGPLRRATLSKAWREAVARVPDAPAGLRVHDCRHAAATMMARMPGVTTKELMARIGHSSPRAALIYQHATEERDRTIATFLDEQIAAAADVPRASVTSLVRPEP
jgi:integrase